MAEADVVFHPEASAEVELAVQRIVQGAHRWPAYDEKHRKLVLRRFPYVLIYREHEERIWIVALAHGHRRPGYWKKRTIPR